MRNDSDPWMFVTIMVVGMESREGSSRGRSVLLPGSPRRDTAGGREPARLAGTALWVTAPLRLFGPSSQEPFLL